MPVTGRWAYATPILLLICSNVFMTLAWYGHLNFKEKPLLLVIVAAWGIAFVEYCGLMQQTHLAAKALWTVRFRAGFPVENQPVLVSC